MNPQMLAPFLAAHAVTSLALGLAILVPVSILLRLMSRQNSAARFAVLYTGLLAIVGIFFLHHAESRYAGLYSSHLPALTISVRWAVVFFYIWGAVALASLTRIAFGLFRLRQLRRTFVPLDLLELRPLLEQRRIFRRRAVQLYHSSQVRVPTAIGFFKPAVVLASWSLNELSPDELKAAALHELAHVDRWDDWTNLLQKLIRAVFFFHPAVWWLDTQLGVEREMSCDDAVLAQSSSPQNYANCLVSLAEKSFVRHQLALAQAAVGHMKQTAARIGRILDGRSRKNIPAWKPGLAAIAVFASVGIISSHYVPTLVVFQTSRPGNVAPAVHPSGAVRTANATAAVHPQPIVTEAVVRRPMVVSKVVRPARKQRTKADEVFALAETAHSAPAINAAAKDTVRREFMYVVMQTRDYDGSGMVKVTTSIWRVQLTTFAPVRGENSPPPHST